MSLDKKPALRSENPMDPKFAPIRDMIAVSAKKYGVPLRVALAFAWLESRFNPKAKGDLNWAKWDNGSRYKKYVLNNPVFAKNPYRNTPEVWHSYGIFQLLAPHFVSGVENPAILYIPEINIDKGVKKIANSLKASKGNVAEARIIYAGASKLSAQTKKELADKINKALTLFPS